MWAKHENEVVVSVPSRASCPTLKFCIPHRTFCKSESVSFSGLFRVINFCTSCNSILTPFLHGNHRNSAVFNEMLQYVHQNWKVSFAKRFSLKLARKPQFWLFWFFETKQNKKSWIFAWNTKETVFSNSFHASMWHITNCTMSKLLELKQTVSPSTFAFVQYPTWYAEFQCREEQGSSLYKGALDGTLTTAGEPKPVG